MTQTFTINDLVRFLYDECTSEEREQLTAALRESEEWRKQYVEMADVVERLNEAQVEPSAQCIEKILEYARERNSQPAR